MIQTDTKGAALETADVSHAATTLFDISASMTHSGVRRRTAYGDASTYITLPGAPKHEVLSGG